MLRHLNGANKGHHGLQRLRQAPWSPQLIRIARMAGTECM